SEIVSAGVLDIGSCTPFCLPACIGSDVINAEIDLIYTGTWDGDKLSIYINGPAISPTVTNLTTGQQIKLNYAVATGEILLIELDPQTQSIVSSVSGVLPPGIVESVSDLVSFYLATRGNLTADGTNSIQITASGGVSGVTSVEVEYKIRHWSLFAPCITDPFPTSVFYAPYSVDADSDVPPLEPVVEVGALIANNDYTARNELYADAALTNLVPNPSFEANTTGWGGLGTGTISRELGNAYSGQYSLRLVANAANDGVRSSPLTSIVVSPSTVYTLQYNLISSASNWRVRLLYYTAASGFISTENHAITTGYNSQQITTPATAAYVYIDFYNTVGGGAIAYFDGIALFEADYPLPYFDGSFTGAAWDGTADNSTSTKAALNLNYTLPKTLSTKWTVSAWCTPVALTGLAPIKQHVLNSDGGVEIGLSAVGFWQVNGNVFGVPILDTQQFITVTYDNGVVKCYIDGAMVLQTTTTTKNITSFAIGCALGGGSEFLGFIRDVAIFDRVLTPNQIKRLSQDSIPYLPRGLTT
ncbi:MAG: LamG domain-containing protein, partial [Anaerolineales bacterium]|nr:LamG domain-containing protein [Anaerolineales bacterium]